MQIQTLWIGTVIRDRAGEPGEIGVNPRGSTAGG